MQKLRHISIIPFIVIILFVVFSCKKDEEDPPPPVVPGCELINPPDSSVIQIGELISIEAVLSDFGDEARVRFSVDTFQLSEDLEAPYEFQWITIGWEEGIYTLKAEAYEPGTVAKDMLTITLIDTIIPPQAPVAVISINPSSGTTDSIFSFDASASFDFEDELESLLFRWDFDGDGSWDTEFTNEQLFLHKYSHPSNYQVRLEVMDSDSMSSDTTQSLLVLHAGSSNACLGYVTIPHGGQVYNTVAIGYQCWLRENMNIGSMISSEYPQTNNDTIEKYCYNNDTAMCEENGGLYQWDEMMKYLPINGGQGICPNGWHVPTDEDWKELESFVDSQYGLNHPVWSEMGFRGLDAGKNMKSLFGWMEGGNGNNLYDFKALPGGFWEEGYNFHSAGQEAHFWSSTHDNGSNSIKRVVKYSEDAIYRGLNWDEAALSIRCLKDD